MKLSTTNLVLSTSAAVFSAYLLLHRKKKSTTNDNEEMDGTKLPPMARKGIFESLRGLAGNEAHNFVMEIAADLNSYVYRLPIATLMGYPNFILLGEPKVCKAILTDHSTVKPVGLYQSFDFMTGGVKSMISSGGDYWHSRRKGVSPAFATKHVRRMNEVAGKKVDEWIQSKLQKYIQKSEAFDVGEEMIDITLSTIAEAAFEYQITDDEKNMFTHECELCFEEFLHKTYVNPFRAVFGLFLKDRRRAFMGSSKIQALALKIIDEYRNNNPNPTKDTIIDRIMCNDAYENDKQRAADIIILLIAGHDTTAYSIAWVLKDLAQNPIEQKKLREALGAMKEDNWHQCELVRKIVKEGMRLHPVAAGGAGRIVKKDFITDSGYLIPKGSMTLLPINLSTCNTNIFKDADKFVPSRWDEPSEEMNDAFLPFAAGKQNCVGQALAMAEMHSVIPKICSKFELELMDEGETKYMLTLKPHKTMLKAIPVSRTYSFYIK